MPGRCIPIPAPGARLVVFRRWLASGLWLAGVVGTGGCDALFGVHEVTFDDSDGAAQPGRDAAARGDAGTSASDAPSREAGEEIPDATTDAAGLGVDATSPPDAFDAPGEGAAGGADVSCTCGPHQSCAVDGGAPACVCAPTACAREGTLCLDNVTPATCRTDADGCLYVASTSVCPASTSCGGMAPSAACAATCSDSCSQGQKSCSPGGLATCTRGANGCWGLVAGACGPHQSCTGPAGSATCVCNAPPDCSAAGTTCAGGSAYVSCATDSDGCLYESGTTGCTGGACYGTPGSARCCTNACSTPGSFCQGNTPVTCAVGGNGCLQSTQGMPCSGATPNCVSGACVAAPDSGGAGEGGSSEGGSGCGLDCSNSPAGHACVAAPDGGPICGCTTASDCPGYWPCCPPTGVCITNGTNYNGTTVCLMGSLVPVGTPGTPCSWGCANNCCNVADNLGGPWTNGTCITSTSCSGGSCAGVGSACCDVSPQCVQNSSCGPGNKCQ